MDEPLWLGRAKKLLAYVGLLVLIAVIVEIATSSWATGLPPQR